MSPRDAADGSSGGDATIRPDAPADMLPPEEMTPGVDMRPAPDMKRDMDTTPLPPGAIAGTQGSVLPGLRSAAMMPDSDQPATLIYTAGQNGGELELLYRQNSMWQRAHVDSQLGWGNNCNMEECAALFVSEDYGLVAVYLVRSSSRWKVGLSQLTDESGVVSVQTYAKVGDYNGGNPPLFDYVRENEDKHRVLLVHNGNIIYYKYEHNKLSWQEPEGVAQGNYGKVRFVYDKDHICTDKKQDDKLYCFKRDKPDEKLIEETLEGDFEVTGDDKLVAYVVGSDIKYAEIVNDGGLKWENGNQASVDAGTDMVLAESMDDLGLLYSRGGGYHFTKNFSSGGTQTVTHTGQQIYSMAYRGAQLHLFSSSTTSGPIFYEAH